MGLPGALGQGLWAATPRLQMVQRAAKPRWGLAWEGSWNAKHSERPEPGPERPEVLRGDWLPGEEMGPSWAMGLVPTHPEGASLDLSKMSLAQCPSRS